HPLCLPRPEALSASRKERVCCPVKYGLSRQMGVPLGMRGIMIKTAAAALTTASMTAYAQPSDDLWSLDGYGTFGMTHSSEGGADYVPNFIVSEGPGLTRDVDTKLDTRLALQLSVHPNER